MTDTNPLPPLPTLQPGDSHMESLIETAIQGHADTRDAMRWLVRQLVPATQPADVTDERQAFEKWLGIRPCGAAHDMAWSAWKARAILALRPATNNNLACESVQARLAAQWGYVHPVQVPMTDEQADALATEAFGEYMCDLNDDIELALVRKVEAHHGITAQAKKEPT